MAGNGETDVDLDSIIVAARQRSLGQRGGRSPVYDLMWDHHARLAPELGRPHLAELGSGGGGLGTV